MQHCWDDWWFQNLKDNPRTKIQTSEEEVWLKENIQWSMFLQMPCKFSSSKVLQISFLPLAPWTEWVRSPLKGKSGLKPQSLPAISSQAQEGGWQSVRRQHTKELSPSSEVEHQTLLTHSVIETSLSPWSSPVYCPWMVCKETHIFLAQMTRLLLPHSTLLEPPFLTPGVFEEKARYQFTIPVKTQTIYIQASP